VTTATALTGFPPVTPGIPPSPAALLHHHPLLRTALEQQQQQAAANNNEWPAFIKPIPDRILSEDRQYLVQKQVFTLPPLRLQNALLAAYVEYVHPYMPLMELHDFLGMVNDRSGAAGKVSLFLYHAVMFSATAFVDEALLRDAGYDSRRDARRAFFSRTRVSCFPTG
jgi:cell division protein FtsL